MKILNLYAGIGGNRKLWGNEHKVTAVEIDPQIAAIYQDFFPNDKVVIADAHQYLLDHFKEYDFIWSSPPCPSHSKIRKVFKNQNKPIYPDMTLYQEILFLQGYFKGKWVVENVIGWYDPLIKPFIYKEHYYWANFVISGEDRGFRGHYSSIERLQKIKSFDLTKFSGVDRRLALRNCVEPEAALYVFNCAFKEKQITLKPQTH